MFKAIKVDNLLIQVDNLLIQFKINSFYEPFDGTSIIELSEGHYLGDNNGLLMIWVGSITLRKVTYEYVQQVKN